MKNSDKQRLNHLYWQHHFISLPNLPIYDNYCQCTGQAIQYRDHYEMQASRTMILVDLPRENQTRPGYPTLVVDLELGQLYIKQTCRQIVNHFLKEGTCGGKALQDTIYECLGIKYRHVIAFGHAAYFSLRGHTRYNTTWIGLHFFTQYKTFRYPNANYLMLDSRPNMGRIYHVVLPLPGTVADFEGYMTDSLKVNQVMRQSLDQHFRSLIGWNFFMGKEKSILTNREYQLGPVQIPALSFLTLTRKNLRRMVFPRQQELVRLVQEERYAEIEDLLAKLLYKLLHDNGLS